MSAHIKWEAVEYGCLNAGDKVRLTHENGDVIHALASAHEDDPLFLDTACPVTGWAPFVWTAKGYSFERAVPERTLPTEAGLYKCHATYDVAGEWHSDNTEFHYLNTVGHWVDLGWGNGPGKDDETVTRMVPASEADELRSRIEKARDYLVNAPIDNIGLGTKNFAVRLLDGEAIHV